MEQRKSKIQIRGLSKKFGDLVVLDQLNFDIFDGEFLCVVGPTGCGKLRAGGLVSSGCGPHRPVRPVLRNLF